MMKLFEGVRCVTLEHCLALKTSHMRLFTGVSTKTEDVSVSVSAIISIHKTLYCSLFGSLRLVVLQIITQATLKALM